MLDRTTHAQSRLAAPAASTVSKVKHFVFHSSITSNFHPNSDGSRIPRGNELRVNAWQSKRCFFVVHAAVDYSLVSLVNLALFQGVKLVVIPAFD